MSRRLVHYLRSERRHNALTQADIATLLGGEWFSRVSWYEQDRLPPIEVALAYEAMFGKPIAELLGGAYEQAVFKVRRRAQELLGILLIEEAATGFRPRIRAVR